MYFLVMSQHTIHYDMNINELRQCCFDSGASLTGFVLQSVSLISMASVVQLVSPYKHGSNGLGSFAFSQNKSLVR